MPYALNSETAESSSGMNFFASASSFLYRFSAGAEEKRACHIISAFAPGVTELYATPPY